MNIGEISEWTGVSPSSIRKYLRDFGDLDCFSKSATPDQGKHRQFTDHDVSVVHWISILYRKHHMRTPDVRVALIERLKSDDPFDLPPRPGDGIALITLEEHELQLAASRRELDIVKAQLEGVLRERDTDRQELARLYEEIGRLKQLVRQHGGDPDPE